MEVKIPKRWIEVADEFERSGFELSVIGAGRPAKGREAAMDLETLTVTIRVPAELGALHFSSEALDALSRMVADVLKAAAARARKSKRSEVTEADLCA